MKFGDSLLHIVRFSIGTVNVGQTPDLIEYPVIDFTKAGLGRPISARLVSS